MKDSKEKNSSQERIIKLIIFNYSCSFSSPQSDYQKMTSTYTGEESWILSHNKPFATLTGRREMEEELTGIVGILLIILSFLFP